MTDEKGTEANLSKYIPLFRAALNGDWERAKDFLKKEPNAVRVFITGMLETALMIAARSSDRINFLRELLVEMDPPDLELRNFHGSNALHMVAGTGNTEAAKLLVNKNPLLPNIFDESLYLPLHIAALFGKREMVLYLLSVTIEDLEPKLFEGESGVRLMHALVASGLYDIALLIIKRQPQLAWEEPNVLDSLALKPESFKSGSRFNFYQHFIYSWVPMKLQNIDIYANGAGIKNTRNISVKQKLHGLFWKIAEISVPQIRRICDIKTTNHHALELVKCLCLEVVRLDHSKASKLLGVPLKIASCTGVHEIVEEVLASFPTAIFLTDEMNRSLFHIAIVNRQENVFNMIYQVEHKHIFLRSRDRSMNNCLHLAGCFGYEQKLFLQNRVAGAALQVQRELQWFKAVEEFTQIHDKIQRNSKEQTPIMVFNETHIELIAEGEKWMKEMSTSYTIVGALIVTIVFAAAITVPGGNNGATGLPMLKSNPAFVVFALSDALALFASTSSVLMFLSILTSRYGVADFLYALPKRLIIGLATLFLSILFMMIAFGATLQIVIGDKVSWILIPVVVLSCIPVVLFVFLQFPLLWDMIKFTYVGVFRKNSNRMFY